jgi:hypothetical protein
MYTWHIYPRFWVRVVSNLINKVSYIRFIYDAYLQFDTSYMSTIPRFIHFLKKKCLLYPEVQILPHLLVELVLVNCSIWKYSGCFSLLNC